MSALRGVSVPRARVVRRAPRGAGRAVRVAAVARPQIRAAFAAPAEGPLIGEALPSYNPTGEWRRNLDLKGWAKEVREAAKGVEVGEADTKHLHKILSWCNLCYFGGLAMAAASPFVNPVAAFFVSAAVMARWTMVGHHVCHGGYNALHSEGSEVTGRFHRRTFARGVARRFTDWLDWMKPEAWDVEHNHLHHFQLGEGADPDLVERNLDEMRRGDMGPMPARYAIVAALAVSWKWYYYGPNTLKELLARDKKRAEAKGLEFEGKPFDTAKGGQMPMTIMLAVQQALKGDFNAPVQIFKSFAPYLFMQFCLVPLAFAPVMGFGVSKLVFGTMVLAEMFTNLHSFIVIATNHVGDDIYRFDTTCKVRSDEFLLRAVIGSANFRTGSNSRTQFTADVNDFMHGFLNYQIEHHMFEDMTMLQYQKVQPKVRAICEKYGVPYVQESVFTRFGQLVDVMVGKRSMLVWERGD